MTVLFYMKNKRKGYIQKITGWQTPGYINTVTIVSIICCQTKASFFSFFFLKHFSSTIFGYIHSTVRTSFLYTASQAPHDDKTLHKARCISPHLSRTQKHGILNLYKDFTHDAAVGTWFIRPPASACSGFICLQRDGGLSRTRSSTIVTDSWFTKRRLWSPPPRGRYTRLACS